MGRQSPGPASEYSARGSEWRWKHSAVRSRTLPHRRRPGAETIAELVLCRRVRVLRGGKNSFGGIEDGEVLGSHRG